MTAPAPQCQPSTASYAHVCPEADCIYYGKRTDPRGCGCHRTREQMMLARIQELEGALRDAKEFADDEYSGSSDLNRMHRISKLCDKIDAALEAKPAGGTK